MNWFKDTMNESRQTVVVHFEAAAATYPIQLFLPFICKKYASLKNAFSDYYSQNMFYHRQFSKSKRQNLSKKNGSGFLFCTNFAIRKCRLANDDSARHDDVRGNGDLSQNSSFEGMNSQKILMQHPFFSFLQKDSK